MSKVDFMRGELVSAARAVLALHMRAVQAIERNAPQAVLDELQRIGETQDAELARLVHNAFGFHGNDIGDPAQLALVVMLMNGEQHSAAQRFHT